MGRVKSGILERIKEGEEVGKEAVDIGTEMKNEGTEIKQILDTIDTSMDEDDISNVEQANDNYQEDFNEAFDSQARETADQASEIEKEAVDTADAEKIKAEDAANKFSQMEGVSDIGRANAETGESQMERSAQEYADQIAEAESISEQCQEEIKALQGDVGSIFG